MLSQSKKIILWFFEHDTIARSYLLVTDYTFFIAQVKIRGRSMQCEACGENATFTQQQFREFDYEKFTQTPLRVV